MRRMPLLVIELRSWIAPNDRFNVAHAYRSIDARIDPRSAQAMRERFNIGQIATLVNKRDVKPSDTSVTKTWIVLERIRIVSFARAHHRQKCASMNRAKRKRSIFLNRKRPIRIARPRAFGCRHSSGAKCAFTHWLNHGTGDGSRIACYRSPMRICFRKVSDERHLLEIARADGSIESVEYETRSYLMHDLLHFAVESEARLGSGFWGLLANGKTLADMNDRTGKAMAGDSAELGSIEQIVGVLSRVVKGVPTADIVATLRLTASSCGTALPEWVSEPLIDAVRERMRQLSGEWNATPCGKSLNLQWPALPIS